MTLSPDERRRRLEALADEIQDEDASPDTPKTLRQPNGAAVAPPPSSAKVAPLPPPSEPELDSLDEGWMALLVAIVIAAGALVLHLVSR
jgi:hypothetical protein